MKREALIYIVLGVLIVLTLLSFAYFLSEQEPLLAPVADYNPVFPIDCTEEDAIAIWDLTFSVASTGITIFNESDGGDCTIVAYDVIPTPPEPRAEYIDGESVKVEALGRSDSSYEAANATITVDAVTYEITGFTINPAQRGMDYSENEVVRLVGEESGAFHATAQMSVLNGTVTGFTMQTPGAGYVADPLYLKRQDENDVTNIAYGTPTFQNTDEILEIQITDSGADYSDGDLVRISDNPNTEEGFTTVATGTVTVANGVADTLTVLVTPPLPADEKRLYGIEITGQQTQSSFNETRITAIHQVITDAAATTFDVAPVTIAEFEILIDAVTNSERLSRSAEITRAEATDEFDNSFDIDPPAISIDLPGSLLDSEETNTEGWVEDSESHSFLIKELGGQLDFKSLIGTISKSIRYEEMTFVSYIIPESSCEVNITEVESACREDETMIISHRDASACPDATFPANFTRGCDFNGNGVIGDESQVDDENLDAEVFIDSDPVDQDEEYDEELLVEIFDDEEVIVEFDYDFENDPPLNLVDLRIEIQGSRERFGYIIIEGIRANKTVRFERINDSSSEVCIRDREVDDIDDFSNRCTSSAETRLECPGSTSRFTCEISGDRFVVSGLTRSAVMEILPGNATSSSSSGDTCTPSWTCTSWSSCTSNRQTRTCTDGQGCGVQTGKPTESQSCSATGACNPNWDCTDWSPAECPENGEQTQVCTDLNNCGTNQNKPTEKKSCKYESGFPWMIVIISLSVFILIIIIIIVVLVSKRHNKGQDFLPSTPYTYNPKAPPSQRPMPQNPPVQRRVRQGPTSALKMLQRK